MNDEMDFGPCMACGSRKMARNIMLMDFRAPVPGTGWGCVRCGLPNDGAVAVICDECCGAEPLPEIKEVFFGYPTEGKRVPLAEAERLGAFEHKREGHPELWVCRVCGCTAWDGGCEWMEMDLCRECEEEPEAVINIPRL